MLYILHRFQPARRPQFRQLIVQCNHFTRARTMASKSTPSLAVKYELVSEVQRADGLKLIDQVSPEKGSKILDIGCGTGFLTNALVERVGPGGTVVGVDPDGERLEVARRKYAADNIRFVKGSAELFPEDQYSLIFSSHVLQWIENKEEVFRKVYRSLRPGGQFAFNATSHTPQLFRDTIGLMGEERAQALLQHFRYLPLEGYVQLATSNGFSVKVLSDSVLDQFTKWPSIDALFDWIIATVPGHFDYSFLDEATVREFKQKYADKELDVYWPRILAILQKPGP